MLDAGYMHRSQIIAGGALKRNQDDHLSAD